jgi:prepilin-type N-terminal cleavage/methylation domain-containing protein
MIVKTHLSRHNRRAMQLRIVGCLCQTLIRSHSAFQRTEPRGHRRNRRETNLGDRALANESKALQRPRLHRAFTLIELLVVIAIIAILIGLLFPAFRAVQDQAKRTQAKNDLTQIVNAVNAYYTDYGKYPLVTADTTYGPGGTVNDLLFNELRSTAAATQNPRQIVFISPPSVKDPSNPRSGIALQATTINGISIAVGDFVDPWGTPYNVSVDGSYDNSVPNPYGPQTAGGAGPDPLPSGVIGWSRGKDQTLGTNGDNVYRNPTTGAQSDDVISWQ